VDGRSFALTYQTPGRGIRHVCALPGTLAWSISGAATLAYDRLFTQPSWRDDNSAAGALFHAPITLSRLIKRYRLGDGRGTVVAGFKPRSKSFEDLRRPHEVAFQNVHAEQPALIVIEIRQVESHLSPASDRRIKRDRERDP
jgi:hypothetical protein